MIKVNIEQHSEAWHQIRLGMFTGSRFYDAMMEVSTKGYKDLLLDVAGEIITGQSEESYVSADMEWGTENEPFARKEYENIFGSVEEVGFILLDENDPLYEFVGYSPDGLKDKGIIEIKCPKLKTHINYIRKNELPSIYRWQVQGGLMVTGAEWCDFISYYPGTKLFITRVYPDYEMHKQLRERLIKSVSEVKKIVTEYNKYDYERL